MKLIKCSVCKKVIPQHRTDLWIYHRSFPGPVCRNHYGVEEEYNRLLQKAREELLKYNIS